MALAGAGPYRLAAKDARQDREDVGGGLAGARLRLAQHILTLECQRNGPALDEGGLLKGLLCDGLDEAGVQAQFGEGWLGWGLLFCCVFFGLCGLCLLFGTWRRLNGLAILVEFPLHGGSVAVVCLEVVC
jgi:hypothetical protein